MLKNFSKRIPADGNTAAATAAYQLSETSFIYPITPATPMGELMDAWIAQGRKNVWGNTVHLNMMESEAGVAGALHGATATGTVGSSFTSAQGLLLMIPDMYKLAQEYCAGIIHVASRAVANGGMSIFNDHSDVYATRSSGIPILASGSVQEAYDMAAIAHLTSIKTGLPFLHFFDGFRTSHEINSFQEVPSDELIKLVDQEGMFALRQRALNPEHPKLRGVIMPAEFHWQVAEKANPLHAAHPKRVADMMDQFAKVSGRHYKPFEYYGHPEATNVVIIMASGGSVVQEYVHAHPNEKIGVVRIHLYRPFSVEYLLKVLPKTVKKICVLDKVREYSGREPLFTDVVAALVGHVDAKFIGGRYGIGSKDFSPSHVEAVFKNLEKDNPQDSFTVGLAGSECGLPVGKPFDFLPKGTRQCIFWGLGSDGTVGANKDAIKIIMDNTPLYGQAYFAYSAHKSGGVTVSHVRFGEEPIDAAYLIQQADYIACHAPNYVRKFDMLKPAKDGSIFVLNVPEKADLDQFLPPSIRKTIAEKHLQFYRIDANAIAERLGLAGRINMIMQTVFFQLSNVMPAEKCISLLKKSIEKTYIRKGRDVIEKNWAMVDNALNGLHKVDYPASWANLEPEKVEEWKGYNKLLQYTMQQRADDITVAETPHIGAMPLGTSKLEKRGIALNVPEWDPAKCIQCNLCSFTCPHAVIRPYLLTDEEAKGLKTIKAKGKEIKQFNFRIQISPYDCTGCGVCVARCPTNALKLVRSETAFATQDKYYQQCLKAPNRGHLVKPTNVRNSQFRQPLLEFNGACGGCGEPAIIKLITQLYGDQLYLANAAGCSVVWSASFPWCPYVENEKGHGPAWAFSLFEDNAEYGFGMHNSVLARRKITHKLIEKALQGNYPQSLKDAFKELLANWDKLEESAVSSEKAQKELAKITNPDDLIKDLISQQDVFAMKTIWIMGGDGWAYDIGFNGLDHVIASGENVNIIVLDTEVYSNTGGQCSKATQRSAVANFAAAGYAKSKKDLGAMAISYGNVYVGMTCHLADPEHALKCIKEAREYNGPAIVINYSPCINHGIKKGMNSTPQHAKELLKAGYLILYRYDPRRKAQGKNPLQLDSKEPDFNLDPLFNGENRFASLKDIYPKEAAIKRPLLQQDLKNRYNYYANLAKQ